MAYLQYFGAGLLALGIFAVVASIVSPDQGGAGTIVLGVVVFFTGVAIFAVSGRQGSSSG